MNQLYVWDTSPRPDWRSRRCPPRNGKPRPCVNSAAMASPRSSQIPRRLLGAAVWGLLLGGIFAMHGLGTHGTGAHAEMEQPAMSNASAHMDISGAGHPAHVVPESESTSSEDLSWVVGEPAGSGSMTGLMAMCLAILGGVLAGFVALFMRYRCRRPLMRAVRQVHALVIASRDRDPPCLVRLSVMRC